jgi:glucose-6-phosphate dehydrogenase assembly protein OpcA
MQQIQLGKTLDVEVVESRLAEMWQQTAGDSDDDAALLRARVANLLIFVPSKPLLREVEEMMPALTAVHPSRVLVMLGLRDSEDRDIEMSVSSLCDSDKRTGVKRLCCEEVTMKAQGGFAAELPSAALPLLVSDLSTFLWWRDALNSSDKIFDRLLRATDRLVIDSAELVDADSQLPKINQLFTNDNYQHVGISDLNWARLTLWRGLLADFYDVPAHGDSLEQIARVRVNYSAGERQPATVAPQALLIAGWLASRLGWKLLSGSQRRDESFSFKFSTQNNRTIELNLTRVERGKQKAGRLVKVKLETASERDAAFTVKRTGDGIHIVAEAQLGTTVQRGRTFPVRNRSLAQLLSREMEILCNDNIYQEAVSMAAIMIDSVAS